MRVWSRTVLVGCAASLLAVMTPAGASAPEDEWRDASAAQSRAIGVAYARCAVRRNRNAVAAYLADPFGTDDAVKLAAALPPDCLTRAVGDRPVGPGQLRFTTLLVRGLLFEALYERDFARKGRLPALEQAPPRSYPIAGVDPDGQTMRRDYRALMKIGDCVVRAAPDRVSTLLSAAAASDGEKRALEGLHDAWTRCLPGPRTPAFSVEMIRATLAEPLYRLVQAMPDPNVRSGA